jgi:uncharacterized protein YndB with AHSA1/START domain
MARARERRPLAMPQQTRGYAHRVDIRADIAAVWQSLIDPARLMRWYAPQARVDAREGGSYWVRLDAELTREAHIDVFLPPRRLRLIYMPSPELPNDETVIVDDFLLHSETPAPEKGGALTILRLLGSGIPDGQEWNPLYLRLRTGWERGLLRLKASLEPAKPPAAPKK